MFVCFSWMMAPKSLGNGSKSQKMHGRKHWFVSGIRSDLTVCWSDLEILPFFTIDIYTVPLWALPKHWKTQRTMKGNGVPFIKINR